MPVVERETGGIGLETPETVRGYAVQFQDNPPSFYVRTEVDKEDWRIRGLSSRGLYKQEKECRLLYIR
jgi:hypothetical protein